jgi:Flp pilus assembly protein TadB
MIKSKLLTVGIFAASSFVATSLIVNPNVWFMVAASAVMGYRIVVKNRKQVQLQKA